MHLKEDMGKGSTKAKIFITYGDLIITKVTHGNKAIIFIMGNIFTVPRVFMSFNVCEITLRHFLTLNQLNSYVYYCSKRDFMLISSYLL